MNRWSLIILMLLPIASRVSAQNVSGYGTIPDPFLFLLREPAVHDDLRLSAVQKQRLVEINESFDGILLTSRNMPPQESQKHTGEVMTKTREQVAQLLSGQQQERLRQIAYRLRGLPFVLIPQASEQLGLSDNQEQEIETVVSETLETISQYQSRTYQGADAHQESQQAIAAAQKREQERILAVLDKMQKQKLLALIGRKFDASLLGRVSFKAPELADGEQWINSDPLKLADLRGKVVALHFYAFG